MSWNFISYRRDDSAGHAGRLFDRLSDHFGRDQVFMDIDSIEPGVDFAQVVEDTMGRCDAVVALIGPHWLTVADSTGRRRLDNPEDFVRLELATALKRGIRVIPALVHGAAIPRAEEHGLPQLIT
jgi:TIR domain